MIEIILSSFEKLYGERPVFLSILVAIVVLSTDYITGKLIQFPILYALPVGMVAWRYRKNTAMAIAILFPLLRVGFHFPWHETQSIAEAVINASINIFALVLYAYLIERVAWQTRLLDKKVKTLEGILPICASCKQIRNEKGEYEEIEQYIAEHSEASFSHGLCKKCAEKLYPEYSEDGEK